MKLFSFILFCLCFSVIYGQTFTDISSEQNINHSYIIGEYGGGVSFADWDKDGWDDITLCQNGSNPKFYKNNQGQFELISQVIGENIDQMKQMNWVDFDNDGDRDLFATSYLGNFNLYENVNGTLQNISIEAGFAQTEYETFGNSWGDYNNDGFLDVYICNYNNDGVENILYKNNGDGTFVDVTDITGVGNGSTYSFQALWFDYNLDGWQDLFIINDRLLTENYCYKNVGGTFIDVSEVVGLNQVMNSMSITAGDYDNNGGIDIFITNTPIGFVLHKNNNDGTFTNVATEAGVYSDDFGWSAVWIDYDLDGWQDLHVCCTPFMMTTGQNLFYVNNGDGTFTNDLSVGFQADVGWSHSSAVGDFNNDGSYDLMISQDVPDNSKLWKCNPGDNNHLKVNLQGVVSNMDGVGSTIKAYSNGEMQFRYTFCGEGFLAQNSFSEIFGLGQSTVVDSLSVKWLSGHEDVFYNIDANQTLTIKEGDSIENEIFYSGAPAICPGDSIQLFAEEFDSYLWSTGDTTSSITVSNPGIYSVMAWNPYGILTSSLPLEIIGFQLPILEIHTNGLICFNDSSGVAWVENLEETGISSIEWDNELFADSVYNLSAGTYTCNLTDLNNCTNSTEFEIIESEEITAVFETEDVHCYGESNGIAEVATSGGSGIIEIDWNGLDNTSLNAGEYSINLIDSMGCMINSSFEIYQPDSLSIELDLTNADEGSQGSASIDITGGTEPYSISWSTNEEGFSITDLSQGEYSVIVTDENGCTSDVNFSIINVGLEEINPSTIELFPNPSSGILYLKNHGRAYSNLTIYSSDGRFIEELNDVETDNESTQILNLSHLPTGHYYLQISDEFTQKRNFPFVILKNH